MEWPNTIKIIISNRDKDRLLEWNFAISMQRSVILCLLRHRGKYSTRTSLDLDSYSHETQASSWYLNRRSTNEMDPSHGSLADLATEDDCNSRTHQVALGGNHDYNFSQ